MNNELTRFTNEPHSASLERFRNNIEHFRLNRTVPIFSLLSGKQVSKDEESLRILREEIARVEQVMSGK